MINCVNKKLENSKYYFTYEEKHYPVCCYSCAKTTIKKLLKKKEIINYKEKDLTNLEKINKIKFKDILKQALMEIPRKKKKSLKIKRN